MILDLATGFIIATILWWAYITVNQIKEKSRQDREKEEEGQRRIEDQIISMYNDANDAAGKILPGPYIPNAIGHTFGFYRVVEEEKALGGYRHVRTSPWEMLDPGKYSQQKKRVRETFSHKDDRVITDEYAFRTIVFRWRDLTPEEAPPNIQKLPDAHPLDDIHLMRKTP